MENFQLEIDAEGVAILRFDAPGRSMNTLTHASQRELAEHVARLKGDPSVRGVVIASAKPSGFCAGGDLGELGGMAGAPPAGPAGQERRRAAYEASHQLNRTLRALETCGKPVAAAINGVALGGGLELALATHHRVVDDDPKTKLGLPESTIGLLPGAGGTQRLPRLVGTAKALPMILEGKPISPQDALKIGLVDQVVPADQVIGAARTWVLSGADAVQPWDRKDFRLPGGGPFTPTGAEPFTVGNALVTRKSFGNYPAHSNILRCVYEGVQVPIDAALRIEARYFVHTLMTPQAQAMIRSLFLSMQELNKGAARPDGFPRSEVVKSAVLGAGMMGAGIAYVQAQAGIETVLIDVSQEAADKGKDYSRKLVAKGLERGSTTAEKGDQLLARITSTTDYAAVEGADLVIEAVFENRDIKREVTQRAEARLAPAAVFASNTSTLPITGLAENSERAANFIGLHFFSPVDKMGLVEIILGEKTSPETLAKAVDYVLKIRKTPIVVNDSRGFYTSRVFATYTEEGHAMLQEGLAPALIDNAGRMCGMPRGPLELTDDVAIDLVHKINEQARLDLGEAYRPEPARQVVARMVELGRFGRKNRQGFYDYPTQGPKRLWPGLADLWPVTAAGSARQVVEELKTRLLYRQAVEAARCVDEGVLTDPRYADVGAILGWGFAPWTGGPLSLIDSVGTAEFVQTCDRLAAAHGGRYAPPDLLRRMADAGESFYGARRVAKAAA